MGSNDKQVNLNNVKIENADQLKFISETAQVIVSELDIIGQKECTGQDGDLKTKCTVCKVESGSAFTPNNIDFYQINVGLQSILNIKDKNVGLNGTLFKVFYNRIQVDNQIPIKFVADNIPDLTDVQVIIRKINENVAFPTEDENFTIAEFPFDENKEGSEDAAKYVCVNLTYKSGESNANLPIAPSFFEFKYVILKF